MSDSPPTGRGAAPSSDAPTVDVAAMPRVLGRITRLALRYPWRLGLAFVTSLLAAAVSLAIPRSLRVAVDAGQGHGLTLGPWHVADPSLALLAAGGLVIAATMARGFLTMVAGYQGEYLSQQVAL